MMQSSCEFKFRDLSLYPLPNTQYPPPQANSPKPAALLIRATFLTSSSNTAPPNPEEPL